MKPDRDQRKGSPPPRDGSATTEPPGSVSPSADWSEVEPLLDELLDLEPPERARFLERLGAKDRHLADRILQLLGGEDPDEELKDRLEPLLDEAMEALDRREEVSGRVGPWSVEEEIGRGGMGRVYRATRADGQYQQTVALKVMGERLGDRLARHRFLNERQILARLAHPNVAQLIDGGVLDDGRPYFAMELVQGSPILDFCDQHRLGVDRRVGLLIQLCRGIEYAHRNLIIHRDIKPSNVLVTRTAFGETMAGGDELQLVKLLDFGIAKMTDRDGTTGIQTAGSLRPMTFEYASPEQIRGDDVTTASDLYSLGLVAYELLAGVRPFDIRSGSLSSVARVAEERNPAPRASTRLAQLGDTAAADVAAARSSSTRSLSRTLRADLDHVLDRCLRKRPDARYESVVELRRDLERFLDGLPVRARRGSHRYRLQKWMARNRLAALAAGGVTVALLIGIAGVFWQSRVAARERDRAVVAEERARAINRFLLEDLLGAASPENARGDRITVVEALDESAARLGVQFADQPALDSEVRGAMGDIYRSIGRLPEAERLLESSLSIAREVGDQELLGRALRREALLDLERGDPVAAEEKLTRAHELLRSAVGEGALETLATRAHMAGARVAAGDRSGGLAIQEQVLSDLERLHPDAWRDRLSVMNDLTQTYIELRRTRQAETLAGRTLELQRRRLGPDHPDVVETLQLLAVAQIREDRPGDALTNLQEAHSLQTKLLNSERPDVGQFVELSRTLIQLYRDVRRYEEAEEIARRALAQARRIEGEGGGGLLSASMLNALGVLVGDQGRHREAIEHYRRAADLFREAVGEGHPSTLRALRNHEAAWQRLARTEPGAEAGLRRARQLLLDTELRVARDQELDATLLADIANDFVWRSRTPDDLRLALELADRAVALSDGRNWEALQSQGRALAALGRTEEGLERSLEALRHAGALNSRALEREIPELYAELGRSEEILPFLRSLLERRRRERSSDDHTIGITLLWLARWSERLGGSEEAEGWYREAIEHLERTADDDYWRLLVARSELGQLLLEDGRLEEARSPILEAFRSMLPLSYIDRDLQVEMTRRAIRWHRSAGDTAEARRLEGELERWRRLPINQRWQDPGAGS